MENTSQLGNINPGSDAPEMGGQEEMVSVQPEKVKSRFVYYKKLGAMKIDLYYTLRQRGKDMLSALAKQPLLPIFIPLDSHEKPGSEKEFCFNGLKFSLPKNKYIEVPRQVADYIKEIMGQDAAVFAGHPLNLNNNVAARTELSR